MPHICESALVYVVCHKCRSVTGRCEQNEEGQGTGLAWHTGTWLIVLHYERMKMW